MTQFDNPYANPYMDPMVQPRKTSGLAITALVFSLVGLVPCCVFLAPIGILLGAIGVGTIGSNPLRKGKGMAWSAIIIGIIASVVWGGGLYLGFQAISKPLHEGPRQSMEAGFAGNMAGFKSDLFGQAATASDDDAKQFVESLRSHFGEFRTCHLDEATMNARKIDFEQMINPIQTYPYSFQFSNKMVKGDVEFQWSDPQTGGFVVKFGRMVLVDPDTGEEIIYPPGSQPTPNPANRTSRRPPAPASAPAAPTNATPPSDSADGG